MNEPYVIREPARNAVPLLVSIPHTGTEVPADIAHRFASPEVAALPDTDWHLHELYDFVPEIGATTIYARYSRYVVDLNRPRDGGLLYPGRFETGVLPDKTFAGQPIYEPGTAPDSTETMGRLRSFWNPYHARLRRELDAMRDEFGYALLFDAHSIKGHVPNICPDRLPDLMLGDAGGTSCAPEIADAVQAVIDASDLSSGRNTPFKGGFITRSFGDPAHGIHALQLEMSQRIYMQESAPWMLNPVLAPDVARLCRRLLLAFVSAA